MSDSPLRDLVLKRLEGDATPGNEWWPLVLAALDGEQHLAELLDQAGGKPTEKPEPIEGATATPVGEPQPRVAFLKALEQGIECYWRKRGVALDQLGMRPQLICLRRYMRVLPDPRLPPPPLRASPRARGAGQLAGIGGEHPDRDGVRMRTPNKDAQQGKQLQRESRRSTSAAGITSPRSASAIDSVSSASSYLRRITVNRAGRAS